MNPGLIQKRETTLNLCVAMLKEVHNYKNRGLTLPETITIDVRQLNDWYDNLIDSNYKGDFSEDFFCGAFCYEYKSLEVVKYF